MSKRRPPEAMPLTSVERARLDLIEEIFRHVPDWQRHAAMAALYRFRPDLGQSSDDEWHRVHMLAWPIYDSYFLRLCRLLKMYGVGSEWGDH